MMGEVIQYLIENDGGMYIVNKAGECIDGIPNNIRHLLGKEMKTYFFNTSKAEVEDEPGTSYFCTKFMVGPSVDLSSTEMLSVYMVELEEQLPEHYSIKCTTHIPHIYIGGLGGIFKCTNFDDLKKSMVQAAVKSVPSTNTQSCFYKKNIATSIVIMEAEVKAEDKEGVEQSAKLVPLYTTLSTEKLFTTLLVNLHQQQEKAMKENRLPLVFYRQICVFMNCTI